METWLLFVATGILAAMTPGPAVMVVLARAIAGGLAAGLSAALGICLANVVYVAVSMAGLGALMAANADLFFAAKWLGVAYLAYLAIRAFRAGPDAPATVAEGASGGQGQAFGAGLAVQLFNPKAVIFFGALFPQFIDPAAGLLGQTVLYGATMVAIEFIVLFGYSLLADRALRLTAAAHWTVWRNRATGVLLLAGGVGLALLRR